MEISRQRGGEKAEDGMGKCLDDRGLLSLTRLAPNEVDGRLVVKEEEASFHPGKPAAPQCHKTLITSPINYKSGRVEAPVPLLTFLPSPSPAICSLLLSGRCLVPRSSTRCRFHFFFASLRSAHHLSKLSKHLVHFLRTGRTFSHFVKAPFKMFSKSLLTAFLYLSVAASVFAAPTNDFHFGGSGNQGNKASSTEQCAVSARVSTRHWLL
jgi:hypothetical protein